MILLYVEHSVQGYINNSFILDNVGVTLSSVIRSTDRVTFFRDTKTYWI